MGRYRGRHRTQYDGSPLANQNCAPTTCADGARCSTGGRVDKSGGDVRALVKISEETNPLTKGWSLEDEALAMTRLGIPFEIRRGNWTAVQAAHAAGLFVALPGDSDQFGDETCSGKFDGDHSIGIHPDSSSSGVSWLTGDPICKEWRWETQGVLRKYAEKYAGGTTLRFGVFTQPVPELPAEDSMYPVVRVIPLSAPNPRLWRVAAGVTLIGYDPAQPNVAVKKILFTDPSSAHANAEVFINWVGVPAGQTAPVPRGGPFLQVTDGAFKDLLIVKSMVTLEAATPPVDAIALFNKGVEAGAKKALEAKQ